MITPVRSAALQDAKPQPMQLLGTRVFRGPHLYSQTPMIRFEIDLGALEERPTTTLDGFVEALLMRLPGLANHGCSYGEPGGFVRRMREGTWLGHVIEHVALELQTGVGMPVSRGKTRGVKGRLGVYNVMFAYVDEAVGLAAGRLAMRLVDELLPAELQGVVGLGDLPATLDDGFADLREVAARRALGPTTRSLMKEAERRNIPARRLDDDSLIMFGQGIHRKRIRASCSDLTSQIGTDIAADKDLTKQLLDDANLPVPKGELVTTEAEAVRAAERLGFPVVTKPLDGNHGRGVTIGIASTQEVEWGFRTAREYGRVVIVEQHFVGSDHRILVIGGEVVAVAERVPAHVTGDGQRSIAELVAEVNLDPKRGHGHASVLTRIEIDDITLRYLDRCNMNAGSVPEAGQTVWLRPTANLSTGGTAIDRTDEIHPENALVARRAARIVGLDIAGIDFVCPDITKSVRQTGGGIIEVNAGPGFRMHLEPFQGRPRNVARPVLELLFPQGSQGRIPIFAVTGTNGKTTTVRMLAHILEATGATVGLTTTTGIYLGADKIASGDCSGPKSAGLVLREPSVEVAVFECARGGILR
ncbi:MAG: cyanophycin synthetase, partial [Cypionkella sp.]|uniref:cyanophycin synthetase family protein n=1 Tax=Cypionkella sp. TaxID=2811411 RepID=UPI002605664C